MPYNFKSDDDLSFYDISEQEWTVIHNWEKLPEGTKRLHMKRRPDLFNKVANMKTDKAVDLNHRVPEDYRPKIKRCR